MIENVIKSKRQPHDDGDDDYETTNCKSVGPKLLWRVNERQSAILSYVELRDEESTEN